MIDTAEVISSSTPNNCDHFIPLSTFVAVSLMSFAALLLELGLTRLFSVVLFYHFAFLAISIALLGLGAGAVFACLRREWLSRWSTAQLGVALCTASAIVTIGGLEVVVHTAVSLSLTWPNFWRLTIVYLVSAIPFFLTGLLFSIVFARHSEHVTQLYGADLLGGALACLALVPLLNVIGGAQHDPLRRTGCLSGRSGLGCARQASSACDAHFDSGGTHRGELP